MQDGCVERLYLCAVWRGSSAGTTLSVSGREYISLIEFAGVAYTLYLWLLLLLGFLQISRDRNNVRFFCRLKLCSPRLSYKAEAICTTLV
jgi:hypothetical protein